MTQLISSYHLYPAPPAVDDSDWCGVQRDSAKGKITDAQSRNDTSSGVNIFQDLRCVFLSGCLLFFCQAVCYAPTPLGPAFPRGMCGAIEEGQEEAVKFYNAWKAEVIFIDIISTDDF